MYVWLDIEVVCGLVASFDGVGRGWLVVVDVAFVVHEVVVAFGPVIHLLFSLLLHLTRQIVKHFKQRLVVLLQLLVEVEALALEGLGVPNFLVLIGHRT